LNPAGVTKQEEPKKERFLSALGSSCFVRLAGMDEVNPAGSQKKILKWKFTFAFGIFLLEWLASACGRLNFAGLQNRGAQRLIFSNS